MSNADLARQEKHLLAVLSSSRFLRMEGLGNEVPFFIYPYPPEDALAVAGVKKRIFISVSRNRVATSVL